jgi:hypothetical protein
LHTLPAEGIANCDLKDFKIIRMLEISETNDDGNVTKSLGLSANLDKEFAEAFTGGGHHRADEVFALTDGKIGYVISRGEATGVVTPEEVMAKIRANAAAKLSPVERKALGL